MALVGVPCRSGLEVCSVAVVAETGFAEGMATRDQFDGGALNSLGAFVADGLGRPRAPFLFHCRRRNTHVH